MRITDAQVRKLRQETSMGKEIGVAALRAGMHRNTARTYLRHGAMPSDRRKPRGWKTRKDPFAVVWSEIVERLRDAPELEAKTLFEDLMARQPDKFAPGQMRTFQRHVSEWRAREGPAKELFFPQVHIPGEAMQTDFTNATELGIILGGEPYPHLLCHAVLPYSDWSWATPCRSESTVALKEGVQAALGRLGRVPEWHQTDHSTAATHDLGSGQRGFNEEYRQLVEHYDMKPRTIGIDEPHENGDVEALNGALKRSLTQHLLLRRSREFADRPAYVAWLEEVLTKRNRLREKRLAEDLAAMRPLPEHRLPAYSVLAMRVGPTATIRVKSHTYSVPSRLKGEQIRVHLFDDRLEVYHGAVPQLTTERLRGKGTYRIEYRHVIEPLVLKPGAFRRYRYFESMFPRQVFREAYEALDAALGRWPADVTYLRVLKLAAFTVEEDVATALRAILDAGETPLFELVEARVAPRVPALPAVQIPAVDLASYDDLLAEAGPEVA